jgi:hypothetical protein
MGYNRAASLGRFCCMNGRKCGTPGADGVSESREAPPRRFTCSFRRATRGEDVTILDTLLNQGRPPCTARNVREEPGFQRERDDDRLK